jgi:hypothetical protein
VSPPVPNEAKSERQTPRSSFLADPHARSYTEKDWNVDSPAHVEKNGANSYGGHSYAASKTLAERAFWSESTPPLSVS